jgi:hypothetical protein
VNPESGASAHSPRFQISRGAGRFIVQKATVRLFTRVIRRSKRPEGRAPGQWPDTPPRIFIAIAILWEVFAREVPASCFNGFVLVRATRDNDSSRQALIRGG